MVMDLVFRDLGFRCVQVVMVNQAAKPESRMKWKLGFHKGRFRV